MYNVPKWSWRFFLWVNGKIIESYLLKQHIFHSSKLIKNFVKYIYCCLEQYNTLWDSSNSVQYKTGISMVSDRDIYSDSKIPRHATCNIHYVTKCHQDFLICTWLKLVFSRSHCCISHAVFFSLIGECLWILMLSIKCFIFMLVTWAQVISLKIKKQNIFNEYKVCSSLTFLGVGGWVHGLIEKR